MNTVISIVDEDFDPITLSDLHSRATPNSDTDTLDIRSKEEMEWLSNTVTDWS